MNISTKCSDVLLSIYKNVNRTGLLDSDMAQSLYVSAYFTYKKYLEDPYARLVKHYGHLFKDGHIIDIGANIGYTAYVFSKIIDDNYKIFAFEPEERNVGILKKASEKYNFANSLVFVAAAVGDKDGEIELWKNEAHNGDHRILTDTLKSQLKSDMKIQKTSIVTIDGYLKDFGSHFPISFIKIDVQGYELAVCNGMVNTLASHPETTISFEYSPSIIESLGFNPQELLQFFQERGYQFYFLNKMNLLEPYDIKKGNMLLRQKFPHDYIDLLCSQRALG